MISPSMQPTDHISMAAVYSEQLRSNSGARYHRVTTYSVIKSVSDVVLARPKSAILRSQLAFNSKLLGFRSRCKTFAECTYLSPRSNWYRKYWGKKKELKSYCKKYKKHATLPEALKTTLSPSSVIDDVDPTSKIGDRHHLVHGLSFIQSSKVPGSSGCS